MYTDCKDAIYDLTVTVQELLEALDASSPDDCDCGGSSICVICSAHKTLRDVKESLDYT